MTYTESDLERIFARTNGCCHLCHARLAYVNYGLAGRRGGWEVEHSVPRAKGGSDHGNNLFAAHITCNRRKGALTSRTVRAWSGKTRAPHSAKKLQRLRHENGVAGAVLLGVFGLATGPIGAALCAGAGYAVGQAVSPKK
ncbi:MAG: HNH endonuclease [Opitutae bacterium]|nr:HNH endonuclease [Opitutae bacterium]